uniref:Uncharacterized protein n=1 Tax=viral metagenome TaxID=1070528 RepID=A0A6C0AZB0_9ZZZZ|tara:strand:- start:16425 stop:16727 length:303 start_codon:yes stop_codon:yes gene_type:complete
MFFINNFLFIGSISIGTIGVIGAIIYFNKIDNINHIDNILLNKETQTDVSNNQSEYKDKSIQCEFCISEMEDNGELQIHDTPSSNRWFILNYITKNNSLT